MPCSDCVVDSLKLKAELAARKSLMVEWFQVFFQEMKSLKEAQTKTQTMTGEVMAKLTSLEAAFQVQFS